MARRSRSMSRCLNEMLQDRDACGGQPKSCYVEALKSTQDAYEQSRQDVAASCGAGGSSASCKTAQADMAQLYVNQKALAQSVATMTDNNTIVSNAIHNVVSAGVGLLAGCFQCGRKHAVCDATGDKPVFIERARNFEYRWKDVYRGT